MLIEIKNIRVCDPTSGQDLTQTIWLKDGVLLVSQPEEIPQKSLNGEHWALIPGLMDAHTHLRDPGQTEKEDLLSGSRAAVAGGYTSLMMMPNTNPVIDSPALVSDLVQRGREVGLCQLLPTAACTLKEGGEMLSPYQELKEAGAVALTDDGHVIASSSILKEILEEAWKVGLIPIDHPEERSLSTGKAMNDGASAQKLGVPGMGTSAESIVVARDILLAGELERPIHLCHVSTKASVDLIRFAKLRDIPVTADTCPHYFALTDEACLTQGTRAKMYPPLRSEKDRQAVIEGLMDGTIDLIATDHAPHTETEKNRPFEQAPNGIIGLETAFPLSYTLLCKQLKWNFLDLLKRMTVDVSRIFSIPAEPILPGLPLTACIVDLDTPYTVSVDQFHSKSHNSPFDGWNLYGRTLYTFYKGALVYEV